MVRLAVIGTNFITERFLSAAKGCKDLKLTAVYSRSIEKAKEFAAVYQVEKVYDDLEKLANDSEIDGVYIASPNSLHCRQSVLMLSHKKHVICEKPIASNSEELSCMLKAANDNGVILLEAMRPVFDPGYDKIVENLPKIGKVRKAVFEYCQYSSRYDNFKKGIIENAFDPKFSNGALMDIGVYCVHPMVKLFGRPKSILAACLKLENGVDGEGTIVASYDDLIAELNFSKISDGFVPSQIQGENGSMSISVIPDPKTLTINYRDGQTEIIEVEKSDNNMLYEILEWVRLIESGETKNPHNQYSVWELEVMDEARRQMEIVFPADKQK